MSISAAANRNGRGGARGGHDHAVQFYQDDSFLLERVDRFLGEAVESGAPGVLIATREHRDALESRWRARGLDLAAAERRGDYVAIDANETLARFMVDGGPEERRFSAVVGDILRRAGARARGRRVRAFGEMVAVLGADRQWDAAIRLEQLWNDLLRQHPVSLLCAYPMRIFGSADHAESFRRVCGEHSGVHPAETHPAIRSERKRSRAIAQLQQMESALGNESAERRRVERALRTREREITDLIENSAEGIHQIGPDGVILWANRAQLELLGYEPEEYIGHPAAEFHASRQAFDTMWSALQQQRTLYDFPAELRCRDGSLRHVQIHSNGLWEDGQLVHTRCFIRDVTERRRLEQDLRRSVEELAEHDRRKDEFLAMLGHELRNPLAPIFNALHLLRLEHTATPVQEHARDMIERHAGVMARMVEDLLEVSRISTGRIPFHPERIALDGVIEQAVEAVHALIDQRRHQLDVSGPKEPIWVQADPARLGQVVINLLANAAKFTPDGGRITVATSRDGDEATLVVRDTGPGIAIELVPRLFDMFVQGERPADRAQGGLGIGLAVVQRLVNLHGGRVEVASTPGQGSEFSVRLPAAASPATTPQPGARNGDRDLTPIRVLVVDDNVDAAQSLGMLLETSGHQVQLAHDGPSGLARALEFVPRVALMDIGLPGMDGYELARRMRAHASLEGALLVALTGYGQQHDRNCSREAGFDHHLVKPASFDRLRGILATVARERTAPQSAT